MFGSSQFLRYWADLLPVVEAWEVSDRDQIESLSSVAQLWDSAWRTERQFYSRAVVHLECAGFLGEFWVFISQMSLNGRAEWGVIQIGIWVGWGFFLCRVSYSFFVLTKFLVYNGNRYMMGTANFTRLNEWKFILKKQSLGWLCWSQPIWTVVW